jgi:hypothetical protein
LGGTSKLSEPFVMGQSKRLLAKLKNKNEKTHSETPWKVIDIIHTSVYNSTKSTS